MTSSSRIAHFSLILLVAALVSLTQSPAWAVETEAVMQPNDEAVFTERLDLPYGAPITTALAKKITAAAIAEGIKNGWTVAVAVVDPGGVLVYFEKMDNTQNASPLIAVEKARTAAAFRRNTKLIEDRVVAGRLQYLGLPGAMPIEGGLPIIQNGQIVGAFAVSGARSEQDGICAKAALDALVRD